MADVLNRLYDGWPRNIRLDMEDTREATKVGSQDEREAGQLWTDLWEWLENEDIVRTKGRTLSLTRIGFAVLTARGFQALDKPVPGSNESFGTKMGDLVKIVGKEAVTEGAKTAAGELVKGTGIAQTMGEFIGGFVGGYMRGQTGA